VRLMSLLRSLKEDQSRTVAPKAPRQSCQRSSRAFVPTALPGAFVFRGIAAARHLSHYTIILISRQDPNDLVA
jgi:hypothetical protein